MRGIVPDDILNRTDKIGFQTPDIIWLKSEKDWVQQVLSEKKTGSIPLFNQKQLILEWERILHGSTSFSYYVWRWINLIKWSDHFNIQYT